MIHFSTPLSKWESHLLSAIVHQTINNIVKEEIPHESTEFIPVEQPKKSHSEKKGPHKLHSKSRPNHGTVGYQQIITHGINTYYDIPKFDKDIKELKFEDEPLVGEEVDVKDPFGTEVKIENLISNDEKLP